MADKDHLFTKDDYQREIYRKSKKLDANQFSVGGPDVLGPNIVNIGLRSNIEPIQDNFPRLGEATRDLGSVTLQTVNIDFENLGAKYNIMTVDGDITFAFNNIRLERKINFILDITLGVENPTITYPATVFNVPAVPTANGSRYLLMFEGYKNDTEERYYVVGGVGSGGAAGEVFTWSADHSANSFDLTNIDRLRFVDSSGAVAAPGDPSILLKAGTMVLNVATGEAVQFNVQDVPIADFFINSTNSVMRVFTNVNNALAIVDLTNDEATPNDDQLVNEIQFHCQDDVGPSRRIATISNIVEDVTAANMDASLDFAVLNGRADNNPQSFIRLNDASQDDITFLKNLFMEGADIELVGNKLHMDESTDTTFYDGTATEARLQVNGQAFYSAAGTDFTFNAAVAAVMTELVLQARVAPVSPINGEFWHDTADNEVYVRTGGSTISLSDVSGANVTLSNLSAGLVLVNTTLKSDSDGVDDLGSISLGWDHVYCRAVIFESLDKPVDPLETSIGADKGLYLWFNQTEAGDSMSFRWDDVESYSFFRTTGFTIRDPASSITIIGALNNIGISNADPAFKFGSDVGVATKEFLFDGLTTGAGERIRLTGTGNGNTEFKFRTTQKTAVTEVAKIIFEGLNTDDNPAIYGQIVVDTIVTAAVGPSGLMKFQIFDDVGGQNQTFMRLDGEVKEIKLFRTLNCNKVPVENKGDETIFNEATTTVVDNTNDFLLIYDASRAANDKIRKINPTDLGVGGAGGGPPFDDNQVIIQDEADNTKTLTFNLSLQSAGAANLLSWASGGTRTHTFSSTTGTVAQLNLAQTWTNTQSFNGDVNLGNGITDTISMTGRVDTDLIPLTDSNNFLGADGVTPKFWAGIYTDRVNFLSNTTNIRWLSDFLQLEVIAGDGFKFILGGTPVATVDSAGDWDFAANNLTDVGDIKTDTNDVNDIGGVVAGNRRFQSVYTTTVTYATTPDIISMALGTFGFIWDIGPQVDKYEWKQEGTQIAQLDKDQLLLNNIDLFINATSNTAGWIDMEELTADPSAPATNRAKLYLKDVGGKTALFARFQTGVGVQIAIEL